MSPTKNDEDDKFTLEVFRDVVGRCTQAQVFDVWTHLTSYLAGGRASREEMQKILDASFPPAPPFPTR
jgi:hypothetical protein